MNSVAEAEVCKMPITNLARIFGPTIIGYSCPDPLPEMALKQLKKQHLVKSFSFPYLWFAGLILVSLCNYRPWRGSCSSRVIIGLATWTWRPKLSHLLQWVHTVTQELLQSLSKFRNIFNDSFSCRSKCCCFLLTLRNVKRGPTFFSSPNMMNWNHVSLFAFRSIENFRWLIRQVLTCL